MRKNDDFQKFFDIPVEGLNGGDCVRVTVCYAHAYKEPETGDEFLGGIEIEAHEFKGDDHAGCFISSYSVSCLTNSCDYHKGVVQEFIDNAGANVFYEVAQLIRSLFLLIHKGKDLVEVVEPDTGNSMTFFFNDMVDAPSQRLENGKRFTLRLR